MGPPAFAGGNHRGKLRRLNVGQLQWGHRLSPVETTGRSRLWKSGETLQWGHRLSPVETRMVSACCAARPAGFNGATGFRRWKQVYGRVVYAGWDDASMGPPAFAGGNPA